MSKLILHKSKVPFELAIILLLKDPFVHHHQREGLAIVFVVVVVIFERDILDKEVWLYTTHQGALDILSSRELVVSVSYFFWRTYLLMGLLVQLTVPLNQGFKIAIIFRELRK